EYYCQTWTPDIVLF
nr:immunoglobulin light chain junction region [Macaca mulatta]